MHRLSHSEAYGCVCVCVCIVCVWRWQGLICNTQQHAATRCNTNSIPQTGEDSNIHITATHCNILLHTATHCNALHHIIIEIGKGRHIHITATQYKTLQYAATHCNPQYLRSAGADTYIYHCNALQHTALRCNTLQHKAY